MNDKWRDKLGKRWQAKANTKIAHTFRSHVDTPSNRAHGRSCRIHREPCFACAADYYAALQAFPTINFKPPLEPGEAHHIDYVRPFVVVWVCHRHHREVDHGSLKIPKKAIWDYSSLIPVRSLKRHLKQKSAKDSRRRDCDSCNAVGAMTEAVEQHEIFYGEAPNTVKLSVLVPVWICSLCHFAYTEGSAEDIRQAAVREHQKSLSTPLTPRVTGSASRR